MKPLNATKSGIDRRDFLMTAGLGAAALGLPGCLASSGSRMPQGGHPNVVYVFADQWRAQATGYAGDPNVHTPNLDHLAKTSINFSNAVSGCPVCSPYRASLLTGQYPLTHGIFLNDLCLREEAVTMGEVFKGAGYNTAYIGKWHLDGHGRSSYIPGERRQGFDTWKVLECTHNYNLSRYYEGEGGRKRLWRGYDAIAQTHDAARYIQEHARKDKPFLLILSFGPPHNPYRTAPSRYKEMYQAEDLVLRPNVPARRRQKARRDLAGYYAHISALDDCLGNLLQTIRDAGVEEETLFVFTSDHGDMLGSQGVDRKQKPWDESIRVPFLLRGPGARGVPGRTIDMPLNTPDILPTLLGLAGIEIPETVEGADFSGVVLGSEKPWNEAVLITCVSPAGEWPRGRGREFRGIRTRRYTFTRDLNGPWLFYDNQEDPYQMDNRVNRPEWADVQEGLEKLLAQKLKETEDRFLPGEAYIKEWGYIVDETGTVPYTG